MVIDLLWYCCLVDWQVVIDLLAVVFCWLKCLASGFFAGLSAFGLFRKRAFCLPFFLVWFWDLERYKLRELKAFYKVVSYWYTILYKF